jgi:hypothetical protein
MLPTEEMTFCEHCRYALSEIVALEAGLHANLVEDEDDKYRYKQQGSLGELTCKFTLRTEAGEGPSCREQLATWRVLKFRKNWTTTNSQGGSGQKARTGRTP